MSETATDGSAPSVHALPPQPNLEWTPLAVVAPSASTANTFLKRLVEYKEFISIIAAVVGGLWLSIEYFVARETFVEVMILDKCQAAANTEKLSERIEENFFIYYRAWAVDKIASIKEKHDAKHDLTRTEVDRLEDLQRGLDSLTKARDLSAGSPKKFQEALETGTCDRLITVQK